MRLAVRSIAPLLALAALAVATLPGCSKSTQPARTPSPPPTPDTPRNALELLRWSWEHRDTLAYAALPTADFWFGYTNTDTVTNPLGPSPWTRDSELAFARHLFVSGTPAGDPASTAIVFSFQSEPIPTADSRFGRDPGWHQEASATIAVQVQCTDGSVFLVGAPVRFFLVRGDSAALTPAMIAGGMTRSPSRWYVEGWNELNTHPNTTSKFNSFVPVRARYQ